MPVIPYTTQKSVQKTIGKKKYWCCEYKHVLVNVNDKVAAFLKYDDKREERYDWKIKKQKQRAKIYTMVYLDEIKLDNDGEEYVVEEMIEDTANPENYNPLEIAVKNEAERKREQAHAALYKVYKSLMTKKQFEVWKLRKQNYSNVDIAKMLKIDESSVRERLKNASKRIKEYNRKFA